jgi:hypothetical protein
MLRSFWNLVSEDLGLDAKGVWVAQVTIPATAPYMEDTGIPVQQTTRNWIVRTGEHFQAPVRLVERLRVDPRVSAAAVAQGAPLTGGAPERNVVRRVGAPPLPEDEPTAFANWVEPGWFELMGMERVAGRLFGEADTRRGTPRVAVVSRSVAERYWPAGDAVGGRFLWHRFQRGAGQFDMTEEPVEIVGVVESIQDVQIGFPGMEYGRGPTLSVYFLRSQTEDTVPAFNRLGSFRLFVRPRGDAPVRDAVLDALAAEAPDLTLLGVRPLTEVTGRWVRTPRFYAFLLAVFGGASALLVAVGIAGVMAMAVTHRTREIGIRVALGATRAAVLRLVLRGTLALALLGLALGTGGALFLARFLASQLHELGPNDPLTLAAAVAFMLSVSLLAAWLPARSVTGIDPARVLRAD